MDTKILDLVVTKMKKKEKSEFKSGFYDLDETLFNIEKGNIIVIGGRPAMGKTSFAISICINLLQNNKKIAFFCLDTTKENLIKKFLINKSKKISEYFIKTEKDFEEIEKAKKFFKDKKLVIEDKTVISVDEIETKIKEETPDVAFIDYIQLIKQPKAANSTEAINLVIQALKRIARETNTLIVLLSSMSRSVESRIDKHPILSDLRNGSLLEEISDVVILLYRDAYYNANTDIKNMSEVIIAKNKNGPTSTIILNCKFGLWENIKRYNGVCRIDED